MPRQQSMICHAYPNNWSAPELCTTLYESIHALMRVVRKVRRSRTWRTTRRRKRRRAHISQRTVRPIVIIIHPPAIYHYNPLHLVDSSWGSIPEVSARSWQSLRNCSCTSTSNSIRPIPTQPEPVPASGGHLL